MSNIWNEVSRIDSTNPKAIDKAIKGLGKTGRKFALLVHAALVAAVEHSVAHKDASKVTMLWDTLGSYGNKPALRRWLEKYTHLKLEKDKAGVTKFLGRDPEKNEASYIFILEGADVAFFDMPENAKADAAAWELATTIYNAMGKAERLNKEGKLSDKDKAVYSILYSALKGAAEEKKAARVKPDKAVIASTEKPAKAA